MAQKIAILTGGGDVPGLNPAIRAVVLASERRGMEVLGLVGGWRSLVALNPARPDSLAQHTRRLTGETVRLLSYQGGTVLHSSRTNPRHMDPSELPEHISDAQRKNLCSPTDRGVDATGLVVSNLRALGVEAVVAVGGEDTLGYAAHLGSHQMSVVGIPKTMDNDVFGTETCLGFATCVARSVHYIHQLRTCCASHERLGIIEVMGRNSGATSLVPAYLAEADRALVAECPFELDRLAKFLVSDREQNPQRYALVTVSEGARPTDGQISLQGPKDAFGHQKLGGIGAYLAAEMTARTGIKTVVQNLGYLVRSGPPEPVDVMLGNGFGELAVELIAGRQHQRLVAIERGCYTHKPLEIVSQGQRPLDLKALYDEREYRPKIHSFDQRPLILG